MSISIGLWTLTLEPYKSSILYAERATAYSIIGENERAVSDFRSAWVASQGDDLMDEKDLRGRRKTIVDLVRSQGENSASIENFKSALLDLGITRERVGEILRN